MANDFDEFPFYDDLVQKGSLNMSNVWIGALSYFYQNLIAYLTQGGILLPQVTTSQRDALLSPQNGQMIYNTTIDSAQYLKAGVWTSF
jgi:hypothetical protein